MKQEVNSRAMTAWALSSASGLVAFAAGKGSLIETIIASTVCTLLTVIGLRTSSIQYSNDSKLLAVVQCAFLALATALVMNVAADAWPDSGRNNFVPAILLLLAVIGSQKGIEAASGVGAMLMWFLILLFGAVAAGGIGNVKTESVYLWTGASAGYLHFACLLPGVLFILPGEKDRAQWLWGLPILATILGVMIIGTLSADVSRGQSNPLYEFGKSLRLMGVVERYESLVSVALTLSFYGAMSILLSAADGLGRSVLHFKATSAVVALVALIFAQFELDVVYPVVFGAIILWYTVPVIVHKNGVKNILKTDEEK